MTRRFALLALLFAAASFAADDSEQIPGISFAVGKEQGTFFVGHAEITIGRGEDNMLKLGKASVSRKHAKVVFLKGKWWLKDLSSNATFLKSGDNKIAVKDKVEIKNGDTFLFGDVPVTITTR